MNEILNDEMAHEAIMKVCEYLAKSQRADGYCQEKESADFARDLCRELLRASDADGLGGCRLCQG